MREVGKVMDGMDERGCGVVGLVVDVRFLCFGWVCDDDDLLLSICWWSFERC
jgi:hypothetical protein